MTGHYVFLQQRFGEREHGSYSLPAQPGEILVEPVRARTRFSTALRGAARTGTSGQLPVYEPIEPLHCVILPLSPARQLGYYDAVGSLQHTVTNAVRTNIGSSTRCRPHRVGSIGNRARLAGTPMRSAVAVQRLLRTPGLGATLLEEEDCRQIIPVAIAARRRRGRHGIL
jgi:hypothetical protein